MRFVHVPLIVALAAVAACGGGEEPDGQEVLSGISHLSEISATRAPTPTTTGVPSASATVTDQPSATPTKSSPPTATPSEPVPSPTASVTSSPTNKPPDDDPDDDQDEDPIAALEDEVVDLTNTERAKHGCPAVRTNERLEAASAGHSNDMAERDYFDHTSPDGEGPGDRAQDAGYDAWGAENLAMGYPTAEEVVEGWMNSEGHRANILNCGLVDIGVGVADSPKGLYWTQMFGWG